MEWPVEFVIHTVRGGYIGWELGSGCWFDFFWLEIWRRRLSQRLLGHLFIRNVISCCSCKHQRFLGSLVVFRDCIPIELKAALNERLLVILGLWLRASYASSCHFDSFEMKLQSHFWQLMEPWHFFFEFLIIVGAFIYFSGLISRNQLCHFQLNPLQLLEDCFECPRSFLVWPISGRVFSDLWSQVWTLNRMERQLPC